MSLTQINDYGIGNVNLTSLMETLDRQRRGYQAVSLTNYDNTLEPNIAAGSIVEIGGALFKCEADESITGWAGIGNDNDVYIKLVPSGITATAVFTTAAPTWSTSKQGWYDGNDRYIGGLYKDAGGNYTIKWLYTPENTRQMLQEGQTRPLLEKAIEIGDWNMDANVQTYPLHGLPTRAKIRNIHGFIRNDVNGTNYYPIPAHGTDGSGQCWVSVVNDTQVVLRRLDAGIFDNDSYDSTSYNRGWVYIKYQA